MYRVLMPVDADKERAIGQARYVAGLPHADEAVEAVILFVFHEDADVPDELRGFKSADRVESVRRAQEFLEERGVSVEVIDEGGDTVRDILDEAERFAVESIVLGGRKRSPVGKAIFGSVTQKVILNSDLPVVVTGAGPD